MAKKKSSEQRLVEALTELLTKDQLSKMLFALIKQQTTEAIVKKAREKTATATT